MVLELGRYGELDSSLKLANSKNMVTGELITIYEARGEKDTTEGRGGTYLIGYYLDKAQAEESVKGKGVWDGPGSITVIDCFKQYLANEKFKYWKLNEADIDFSIKSDFLRQQALAKLTPEEIKLLGIK